MMHIDFKTWAINHYVDQEWHFTCLHSTPVIDLSNGTDLHWQTAEAGARWMEDIYLLILWPGPCICMSLLAVHSTKCPFMLAVRFLPSLPKPPGPKAISFLTWLEIMTISNHWGQVIEMDSYEIKNGILNLQLMQPLHRILCYASVRLKKVFF